jgi:hypothetical protein
MIDVAGVHLGMRFGDPMCADPQRFGMTGPGALLV